MKLHEDIDNLTEVDNDILWREINKRKRRSNSETNFNDNKIRGAQSVTDHWDLNFQDLYKPDENHFITKRVNPVVTMVSVLYLAMLRMIHTPIKLRVYGRKHSN